MLRVRIDSREVEVAPVSLARMVLDGKVDRHDQTRPSDGAAERPLEYALDPPYSEALTAELLRRLQSLSAPELPAVDIDALRIRADGLCRWRWSEPNARARVLWAAAWLNELTGHSDAAVGHYDAFLQVRCGQPHLRLLAYNNRGAVRICLGRCEGIQDLARAAVVTAQGPAGLDRTGGLPAACFNLLNLINVAVQMDSLAEIVDEELSEFFGQLPEDVTRQWLGPESADVAASGLALRAARPDAGPSSEDGGAAARQTQSILRDPTFRRLNHVTSRLAAGAVRLAQSEGSDQADRRLEAGRLCLWAGAADRPQPAEGREGRDGGDRYDRCAEAASLLLSGDIPSSLVRQKGLVSRAEQLAQEELAEIENLVAGGNHELARSRLEVQRRILGALNHREQLAGLLEQVDTQLRWVTHCEKELEQLGLQRMCGRLVAEMEQFCKLTSLSEAERRIGSVRHGLERHKTQSPRAGEEVVGLLDELAQRVEQHMLRLRRSEVRRRVRDPWRELRQTWPADWAVPVPDSAYAALAECHVNDPESQIADWSDLKDQLDAHQAQYCLRKALAELPSDRVSWDEIETILADALRLAPDLWLTAASLFGLLGPHRHGSATQTRGEVRTALESAAGRLLHQLPSNSQDSAEHRTCGLLRRANALLEEVFRQLAGDARRFVRLWCCVEKTLSPALATGAEDVIAEVEAIATTCLDHWAVGQTDTPTRADPRNPVRIFLESCAKARCLAQAERLLGEHPPALPEAREQIAQALHLGLETVGQLKRAATGIYLAEYGREDSAPIQRHVLARLDEWVEGMIIDQKRRLGEETIVNALVAIRAGVRCDPSAPGVDQPESDELRHFPEGSDDRAEARDPADG